MKYTVTINQLSLAESKLDFMEAAILDYLYFLCSSINQNIEKQRITDDMGIWTWVDYQSLVDDMPLLRITDKTALTRRFKKIAQEGFIYTKYGYKNKLYIRLTEKVDSLYVKPEMTKIISKEGRVSRNDENHFSEVKPEMTKIISLRNDENGTYNYTNTKDDNITSNNTNTTNVVEADASKKQQYGNLDLNEGMSLLEELSPGFSQKQLNRFALKRLYAKKGKDRVLKAIRWALEVSTEEFAPAITNYRDLEYKWEKLELFARRLQTPSRHKRVSISAMPDEVKELSDG